MLGEQTTAEVLTDGLSPQERTEKIFKRMDKDGDEKITEVEFKKAATEDPTLMSLMQVGQK